MASRGQTQLAWCFYWTQKVETKTSASKHAHSAERKVGGEKIKLDSKDQSFWVLMEGALADVLAPAEAAAVIAKMKKVHNEPCYICFVAFLQLPSACLVLFQNMDDVPGSISLEDLDAAAGTLLA